MKFSSNYVSLPSTIPVTQPSELLW